MRSEKQDNHRKKIDNKNPPPEGRGFSLVT
jgi:hypothetical protein